MHTLTCPLAARSQVAMVLASGTALFSDGYLNGSTGEINTILKRLYPNEYTKVRAPLRTTPPSPS